LFRGFDDVYKIASTTVPHGYLCWVWVEEAFEIESEDAFDTLDLSVPRGEVPPALFKQTTLTFNPWSERHWLKKRFFDTPDAQVSCYTTDYRCNEFLDDADRLVFERMKTANPRRYAVAGCGEWGMADGLIFEDWEVREFSLEALPDAWKYRRVYGLDYGYTNDPTAFIAAAVNPLDRVLYIFDEFKERGLLHRAIAERIRAKGYDGERIRADSAEPKSTEEIRREGIYRILSANKGGGSLLHGIARLQEYRMVVHPRCKETVAELSAYAWDEDENGIVNRPRGGEDHLMDALRYAMEDITHFRPAPPIPPRLTEGSVLAREIGGSWR
jgi:phage terminase large subunit